MDNKSKEMRKHAQEMLGKKAINKLMENTKTIIDFKEIVEDDEYIARKIFESKLHSEIKKIVDENGENKIKCILGEGEDKQGYIVPANEFYQLYFDKYAIRKIFESELPITKFEKIVDENGENKIKCILGDGEDKQEYIVPVDQFYQLYFDKMEQNSKTKVDFGGMIKDKVVVVPFQDKIVRIDGKTGQIKKSLKLSDHLMYQKSNSITSKQEPIDERLNPAVLAILEDEIADQKSYMNGTGNIDIVYNFEEKGNVFKNIINKDLAKKMNQYYKSEKEYVEELHLKNELSKKVGYVNFLDKMKSASAEKKARYALEEGTDSEESIKSVQDPKQEFNRKYSGFEVKIPKLSIDGEKTAPQNTRGIIEPR